MCLKVGSPYILYNFQKRAANALEMDDCREIVSRSLRYKVSVQDFAKPVYFRLKCSHISLIILRILYIKVVYMISV